MGRTPHCSAFCRPKGYGKHPDEWSHWHATAKFSRRRKGRWPRPSDGFGGRVADREGQHGRVRARERREARRWER